MKNILRIIALCTIIVAFTSPVFAQPWDINGNLSTNPTINFIGTTDPVGLAFRLNNNPAGTIDFWSGTGNCAIGDGANGANSGSNNTAFGAMALPVNQGYNNTAVGNSSLYLNDRGTNNVAVGVAALTSNINGNYNVSVGNFANAGPSGDNNNAIGFESLLINRGVDNNAMGVKSMYSNVNGRHNTAIGNSALYSNVNQYYNVAVGNSTLYNTGSGGTDETDGGNTAVGYSTMTANINGQYNVAMGMQALNANTSGSKNTSIGSFSGIGNVDGECNTLLGYSSDVTGTSFTDATAIGCNAQVDASHKVRVGGIFVTSIGGQVGWTTFSDARYKKNIKENVPGLDFINKLKPVTYNLDVDGLNKHYSGPESKKNLKHCDNPAAGTVVYTGFLAQDVEKAAKEVNYDFSGVDKPTNNNALYGLRYADFVPTLVKSIQEQQTMIKDLTKTNDELSQRLDKLEKLLSAQSNDNGSQNTNMQLGQNVPNPFSADTRITYTINESGNVLLQLFNAKGEKIRVLENMPKDKGQYSYTLSGADLLPGQYYYTLSLNGRELVRNAVKL